MWKEKTRKEQARRNTDNQECIEFREVIYMDMEKIIEVLISLLEEQEGVEIKYEVEKTA